MSSVEAICVKHVCSQDIRCSTRWAECTLVMLFCLTWFTLVFLPSFCTLCHFLLEIKLLSSSFTCMQQINWSIDVFWVIDFGIRLAGSGSQNTLGRRVLILLLKLPPYSLLLQDNVANWCSGGWKMNSTIHPLPWFSLPIECDLCRKLWICDLRARL